MHVIVFVVLWWVITLECRRWWSVMRAGTIVFFEDGATKKRLETIFSCRRVKSATRLQSSSVQEGNQRNDCPAMLYANIDRIRMSQRNAIVQKLYWNKLVLRHCRQLCNVNSILFCVVKLVDKPYYASSTAHGCCVHPWHIATVYH